jgi:hypothetical protein
LIIIVYVGTYIVERKHTGVHLQRSN